MATPLLGLGAARVGNQHGLVNLEEGGLDGGLLDLVGVLLVVGDEALGDGLAGGVDLADGSTTADGDGDLHAGEAAGTDDVDGLHQLGAEGVAGVLAQGNAVDLNVGLGGLGHGGDGDGGLALAEGLHALEHMLGLSSGHGLCFERDERGIVKDGHRNQ